MENLQNKNVDITLIKWDLHYKDFSTICLICLNKEDLYPFVELNLLKLIEDITDIKIEPKEQLPKNVCGMCIQHLENIANFIRLAKNNYALLKKVLNNAKEEFHAEDSILESDIGDNSIECLDCFNDDKPEIIVEKACSGLNETKETSKAIKHSIRQVSKCNTCGEKFNTKRKLNEHWRENASCKILYRCENCEKCFFAKSKLKLHMRVHTNETPFECEVCLKQFKNPTNLKRHNNIVHKGLKPYKCDMCEKEFATFLRKTEHLRVHTGERPNICSYCGKGFKTYAGRYAHEMRHKVRKGEISKSENTKKYPRKRPENPSELECKICNKFFSSKQALHVHLKIHIGEKSFLCTVCGKGFLRKSHLDVHIRIHTGEKPYKCNECGKYFRQPACYRNHLLIHKGQRSYKCNVCQKTFIQVGHLRSHIKTHTGEKPYKCPFCGKGFAQNGNLKAHTRIHTGEKHFQCSVCYERFQDSTSVRRHKKTHEGVDRINL